VAPPPFQGTRRKRAPAATASPKIVRLPNRVHPAQSSAGPFPPDRERPLLPDTKTGLELCPPTRWSTAGYRLTPAPTPPELWPGGGERTGRRVRSRAVRSRPGGGGGDSGFHKDSEDRNKNIAKQTKHPKLKDRKHADDGNKITERGR